MKIAIIGVEQKPIPAVEGGAVETIVDTFLKYNEIDTKQIIDVYSIYNQMAVKGIREFKFSQGIYLEVKNNLYLKFLRKLGIINAFKSEFINGVLDELAKEYYDWIIIENRPEFILPIRNKLPNAKIALHIHNEHLTKTTKDAKNILKEVDKIITVSNFISEKIKQIDPSKGNKIYTLINRVNIDKFKPNVKRIDLCKKFNISDSTKTMVLHGRMVKEKGVLEAIKSFNLAKIKNKHLKLIIIGDLNSSTKNYRRSIISEVNKSRYQEDIVFTGYINHSEIPDYLNLADFIILPSIWDEPCALAIIESLSVGKPLITTRTGGTPEIVDSNCGIIVNVDNNIVSNLADAINQLSLNEDVLKELSTNCRRYAVSNLDDKFFFSDFLKLLNI